jgi:hypothetical protein
MVIVVLAVITGIIVSLLVVAFGDGMRSVAAIGAIGVIVSAALQFLDRRVGRGGADQEPD